MTLTLATGVSLGSANSYVSVASADLYHENLENTDWALPADEKKEALLSRASTMIDARYTWTAAALLLSAVPSALRFATCELAREWVAQEAVKSADIKSVSVGAISIDFATDATTATALTGIWGLVDMLLNDLGSSSIAVAGASGWSSIAVERA